MAGKPGKTRLRKLVFIPPTNGGGSSIIMETVQLIVCGQITGSPGKICFCKLVLKIIKNIFILASICGIFFW